MAGWVPPNATDDFLFAPRIIIATVVSLSLPLLFLIISYFFFFFYYSIIHYSIIILATPTAQEPYCVLTVSVNRYFPLINPSG